MLISKSLIIIAFIDRKLNFDKVGFYPDGALGCYYGSSFKVDMKQLVLVSDNTEELADKLKGGWTY